jgi:glycosyltransferase involved in cell wall biosynthesis
MKIAILTSGILPVPAVQGGAVENLIDFYLEYNENHQLHDITIYSVWYPDTEKHAALKSKFNHYHFIHTNNWIAKIKKNLYHFFKGNEYYHYAIEYFLEEAIQHIRKHHYDIIIVENRPGFSLKLTESISPNCILHLHNDFLNLRTIQAKKIIKGYKRIISVSDYISERVRQIGTDSCELTTVHNAIDYQAFNSASQLDRMILGLSDEDFVIVYSGRLIAEKGVLELCRAIKFIDNPRIKLLVIGASTYGKDEQPTAYIKQLIEEVGQLKDKIVFTGFIEYAKVPSYLKMADIAVVPSMWDEPFGLTVVEAMAAGLPLITTRSGGIPEICDGVATIVERDKIVENLSNAILDLYNHPEKRKQMVAASRERSKLFDKERYAREFFKALDSM